MRARRHPKANRLARNLLLNFIGSEHMDAVLRACVNNSHTWDNESWANMMHMVLPKRTPMKRCASRLPPEPILARSPARLLSPPPQMDGAAPRPAPAREAQEHRKCA